MKTFVLSFLLVSFISSAHQPVLAAEIRSIRNFDLQFIRVKKIVPERFTYELCAGPNEEQSEANLECILLGREAGYSLVELEAAKSTLYRNGFGVGALDAAILATTAIASVIAFNVVIFTSMDGFGLAQNLAKPAALGLATLALDGGVIYAVATKLNPKRRFDEAKVLSQAIESTDSKLTVDVEISIFAEKLDKALLAIDGENSPSGYENQVGSRNPAGRAL